MNHMSDEQIAEAINNVVVPIIRNLETKAQKIEAASFVFQLGYELLRGMESQNFMAGLLDAAAKDLSESPQKIVIREFH